MRRWARCVGLLVAMAVCSWGSAGRAQPTLGKEQVPSDLPPEVQQKFEALYSADPGQRARAAGEAAYSQDPAQAAAAIPFLMAMLHDDAVLYDEKELLRRTLISSHWRVFSYPNSPGESAAEALAGIIDRTGKPDAKVLLARLADDNGTVRANALRVLGERLGHVGPEDRKKIAAEAPVADSLIGCLGDREPRVRHYAAVVLRYVEDPRAVEPLIGLVEKEPSWEARKAAAAALGAAKDILAVEPLTARLADPAERVEVRTEAAAALGQIGDPGAVQPLVAALEDGDVQIRRAATVAVASVIRDPAVLRPLLDDALHDADWQVRDGATGAVAALAKLGDARAALDLLFRTLGDGHPNVRADAARALGQLGNRAAVGPLSVALRQDKNSYVRWHAAEALGNLGGPDAAIALSAAIEDQDATVRARARAALDKIEEALKSRSIL